MISFRQDCTSDSLGKLQLRALLEKATTTAQCLQPALEVFRKNYSMASFSILGPFVEDGASAIVENLPKSVTLKNFDVIKRVLKTFGEFIIKIIVSFAKFESNEGQEIVKYINNYSLKSLMDLKIRNCKDNVLDDLKSTFFNVKALTFSSDPSKNLQINIDPVTFERIFPMLESLTLQYTTIIDWAIVGEKFPQLKRLSVDLPAEKTQFRPDETHVKNLLQNNLKIEMLSIEYATMSLLNAANTILPHLKDLELRFLSKQYLNEKCDPIRFNNVKLLAIHSDHSEVEVPANIYFSQIKELGIYVEPIFTSKWSEFIANQVNKNVDKLVLMSQNLSEGPLSDTATHLPNLNIVTIRSESYCSAVDVLSFIENSKNLDKLNVFVAMKEHEQNELQLKLRNDWKYRIQSKDDKIMMIIEK